MFALNESGMAVCLKEYKDVSQGAQVPFVNELWEQVEEWLVENGGKWADPPPNPSLDLNQLRNEIEQQRLQAYAHPLTGSDRHFAEAMRLDAVGDTKGAAAARELGLKRYEEIRANHPWPEVE